MENNKKPSPMTPSTKISLLNLTPSESSSIAASKSPNILAQRVFKINQQAQALLKLKQYSTAIQQLRYAEKLLEYTAESCKDIKKELIIVVFHNLACTYQLEWDLLSSSTYLEALLYNLELNGSSRLNSDVLSSQSSLGSNQLAPQRYPEDIDKIQYYLQYCALNSPLGNHTYSIRAARKAMKLTLSHTKMTLTLQKLNQKEYVPQKDIQLRIAAVKHLLQRKNILDNHNIKKQLLLEYALISWKADCLKTKKHSLTNSFKQISIGDIMTMSFKSFQTPNPKIDSLKKSFYYLCLLCSISHFSLSVELTLQDKLQNNQESANLHCMSLLLYLLLVPFQSPYLYHSLQTYLNKNPFQPIKNHPKATIKNITEYLNSTLPNYPQELPQQSVTTPVQSTRRQYQKLQEQRLKVQHQKLKRIVYLDSKNVKKKKKGSKAQSLSISKSKSKKISLDNTVQRRKQEKGNCTNPNIIVRESQYGLHKAKIKVHNPTEAQDVDIGEKYFALAFKKLKSPTKKHKSNSLQSSTSKSRSKRSLKKQSQRPIIATPKLKVKR